VTSLVACAEWAPWPHNRFPDSLLETQKNTPFFGPKLCTTHMPHCVPWPIVVGRFWPFLAVWAFLPVFGRFWPFWGKRGPKGTAVYCPPKSHASSHDISDFSVLKQTKASGCLDAAQQRGRFPLVRSEFRDRSRKGEFFFFLQVRRRRRHNEAYGWYIIWAPKKACFFGVTSCQGTPSGVISPMVWQWRRDKPGGVGRAA
jgi:hypothetical protein